MERYVGLLFVLALHAAVLWGLWQHRMIPAPQAAVTLFVNLIVPSAPKKAEAPKLPPPRPKLQPVEKPRPRQIVAEVQAPADPTDYVAPLPVSFITAPAPPPPAPAKPAEPIALGGELSVACPDRTPPRYPPQSRRLNEEGVVVLRVELDEQGGVSTVRVSSSSGYTRLDEAALAAVRTWRCNSARRNSKPVRAFALQPFKFILQGN